MAVESADFINQLDAYLPKAGDSISEGDVHLRTIKDALKQSFPNVDSPVNAIHTGDTEPILNSAGTVWFDTSTGLIKMRDSTDTSWMVMAHGEATGLGNLIKVTQYEWEQFSSYRSYEYTKLTSWVINPVSATSTISFDATGECTVWGGTTHEANICRFKDETNDIWLGRETQVVGYNHVDDDANFEVETMWNMKFMKANHGGTPFTLGLWGKHAYGGGGSYCGRVTMMGNELE